MAGIGVGGGVGQDRLLPAQRFSFRLACGGSRSLYYDFRFFPMGGCLFNGVLFYGGIQRSLLYDGVPAPRPRGVPAGNAPPRKGSQEPGSPSRGVEGEASPGSSLWLRWPAKLLPSPCGSGGGVVLGATVAAAAAAARSSSRSSPSLAVAGPLWGTSLLQLLQPP